MLSHHEMGVVWLAKKINVMTGKKIDLTAQNIARSHNNVAFHIRTVSKLTSGSNHYKSHSDCYKEDSCQN